jgi:hypothetical protein
MDLEKLFFPSASLLLCIEKALYPKLHSEFCNQVKMYKTIRVGRGPGVAMRTLPSLTGSRLLQAG